jgi:hypothetical protein
MVPPKFIAIFPMLPNPIPYSELESLSSQQRFFPLAPCFVIAFSSFSNFLLNCAKEFFVGLVFFSFLGGTGLGFFQSVFLKFMTIICVVHNICTPMLLLEVKMLLKSTFLWDSGSRLSTMSLVSFLTLVGRFLVGLCV